MEVMVIPVAINALSTDTKGLVQGLVDLEKRVVETIETTVLLGSVRIQSSIQEVFCHSDFTEKQSANAGANYSQSVILRMGAVIKLRRSQS